MFQASAEERYEEREDGEGWEKVSPVLRKKR